MRSELADESNLGFQVLTEPLLHTLLRMCKESTDIPCGSATEIHHDVGVNMRDLSVADAKSLEAALVDQATRANPLDLLEDGPGAGVNLEPRVTRSTPAQVLLHDAMHHADVAPCQPEGD